MSRRHVKVRINDSIEVNLADDPFIMAKMETGELIKLNISLKKYIFLGRRKNISLKNSYLIMHWSSLSNQKFTQVQNMT